MRKVLTELRKTAKEYSVLENPARFIGIYLNRLPKAQRKLIDIEAIQEKLIY